MKTPKLDKLINDLQIFESNDKISADEKEMLTELLEVKKETLKIK